MENATAEELRDAARILCSCASALEQNFLKKRALEAIEKSAQKGGDIESFVEHPELIDLRKSEEYQKLILKLKSQTSENSSQAEGAE